MKKNLILSTVFIGAIYSPLDAEARFFLGLGAGGGSTGVNYEAAAVFNNIGSRYSEVDSLDVEAGFFLIGANTESLRMYVIAKTFLYQDAEVFFFGLSTDYKFNDGLFRPYLGGSLGYAEFEWTDTYTNSESGSTFRPKEDITEGLGLGGQVGILFEFANGLGVDVGMRGLRFVGLTSQFETIYYSNGAINSQFTVETALVGQVGVTYTF